MAGDLDMGRKRHLVEKTVAKSRPVSTAQYRSVKFTSRDVALIIRSLPAGVDQRRLKLLPKILRDWYCNELKLHLSLEPLRKIRDRGRKVQVFEERARDLFQALDALDESGRRRIAHRIAAYEKPDYGHAEFIRAKQELSIVHKFLTHSRRSRLTKMIRAIGSNGTRLVP